MYVGIESSSSLALIVKPIGSSTCALCEASTRGIYNYDLPFVQSLTKHHYKVVGVFSVITTPYTWMSPEVVFEVRKLREVFVGNINRRPKNLKFYAEHLRRQIADRQGGSDASKSD